MRLSDTKATKDLKTKNIDKLLVLDPPVDRLRRPPVNKELSDTSTLEPKSVPFVPSGKGQATAEGGSPPLTVEQPAPDLFPACGEHKCPNEHSWPIKIGLVQCVGCKRMMLGIAFANCPICNEAIASTRLRVDYSTERIGFVPRCTGVVNEAETHFLTLQRDATPLESK